MKLKSRNYLTLLLMFTFLLVAAGCSSSPEVSNSSAPNNTGLPESARTVGNNSGFNTAESNSHPKTDTGQTVKVTDSNSGTITEYTGENVPPPSDTNSGRPNQIEEKMDKIKKLREMAKNQSGPKPTPMRFDAPENSYVTQELSDVAKEVRVFRDHPQLVKIERTHTPKAVTMKVFLKNGKVVDVDGSAVGALRDAPSAKILQLAGVSQ